MQGDFCPPTVKCFGCFRILYSLPLVTAALTQRVISILPKKQLRSVPFQESWRTAVIQIGQVSQTEIYIYKYAISIKHLLSFVVNLKRPYTSNNNCKSSWKLMKHSSVCAVSSLQWKSNLIHATCITE